MRIVIFTSNALRHKYVANRLAGRAQETLIIVEERPSDAPQKPPEAMTLIEKHFAERYETEQKYFGDNEKFTAPTIAIPHREINSDKILTAVKNFKPDAGFVFGASIIREPLLSVAPAGRFVNLHLGLSPYYRGSGTNFWPFINEEPEYVGATLLHIDPGIDTGDIIVQTRPVIKEGDTVHTVGCKTIRVGAEKLIWCLETLKRDQTLPRVKQWDAPDAKYYKNADFTDQTVLEYRRKIAAGLVKKYLARAKKSFRLVEF